ncbi:hypothetical protein [Helicobacter pylori]
MKQKVYSVSYLAKAEFEFKNGVYDLVALPTGAEVVKVALEVVGSSYMTGDVSVGFKDETTKSYFFASTVAAIESYFTSIKDYTATDNKVVVAKVENADASKTGTKGVLRILYFLPSVIEVEY